MGFNSGFKVLIHRTVWQTVVAPPKHVSTLSVRCKCTRKGDDCCVR